MISVGKGTLFEKYFDSDVIDFSSNSKSPVKYAVRQNKKFPDLINS